MVDWCVASRDRLVTRGRRLEYATLVWNIVGTVVVAVAAWRARSVALAGFGVDSLIEIGASLVVVWELRAVYEERRRRAQRLIGVGFVALALYLALLASWALAHHLRPQPSPLGLAWTAATAATMLALARGKDRTGHALDNPVLRAEGRVTLMDALLAATVVVGLGANALAGWWWADPVSGLVIVLYAVREARASLRTSISPA